MRDAARAGTVSVWTGGYVRGAVGIEVQTDPARSLVPVELLVGVALRHNPKRAQLLVSNVLAKHVPTVPGLAIVAAELLGVLVARALDSGDGRESGSPAISASLFERLAGILQSRGEPDAPSRDDLAALRRQVAGLRTRHADAVTIGYAETATGLGQLVAATIGSYYVHSTRHAPVGGRAFAGFEEEHSHASSHQLYPTDGGWLEPGGTVVLVDDELSTGTTIVNTIRALHAAVPQSRWVVAALIDLRSPGDRARFDALAAELGTAIAVVALGAGTVTLPADVGERARAALAAAASAPTPAGIDAAHRPGAGDPATAHPAAGEPAVPAADAGGLGDIVPAADAGALGDVVVLDVDVPAVRSARFGLDLSASDAPARDAGTASGIADAIRPHLLTGSTLVLGSEEFIALPLFVADHLDTAHPTGRVHFSTTTRSPIAAVDRPDYAIASVLCFESHDLTPDGVGPRFAYNLTRDGARFGTIVFLPEPGTDPARLSAPAGIVEALRRVTDRVVLARLPDSLPDPSDWTPAP